MEALLFVAYFMIGAFVCGIFPNSAGDNEPILILIWPIFLVFMVVVGVINLCFVGGEIIWKSLRKFTRWIYGKANN